MAARVTDENGNMFSPGVADAICVISKAQKQQHKPAAESTGC